MEYSIIVESNQEVAKKNYAVDYGTAISTDNYNDEFSNNSWKIKLPQSITLDVGDRIQYYQSMIKSKGVSDESVELIGTANGNQELTDNAGRMQFGYYIYNNWLNNCMLPLGQATLKSPQAKAAGAGTFSYREYNYQDTKHTYNVADETETNIPRVWWSDYGGPSLESIDDWLVNGSTSLYRNANELNATDFGFNNSNLTATNNLAHYVPDTQRLYIGAQDWVGPYINGYTSYHNQNLTGTYSSKYDIVKSNADFQTDIGFNSPIVIGNKITESLNNPNLEGNDEFVNPTLFDYTDDLTTDTSLTSYKNYFDSFNQLQVEDESCKCFPTTYGKMLYDLQNGVDNFSINTTLQTKTGIVLPTSAQKIKYFWNCVSSGDYKRTIASSELYSNLNLSKNIVSLNLNSLATTSFFSGSIPPDKNYPPTPPSTTKIIAENAAYAASAPYDLGEQFCLFDNFDGAFSSNFDATEIAKITNNIIFRSDTQADYNTIKKPTTADEYLNLTNNQVFMTNMIANDSNFDKLKKVRDLLEKPSADDIKIDYTDQTFLDSLYFSLEVGALDDRFSQSVYGISGNTTREETGIPLPVALPCVKSIADKLEVGDTSALSYISYKDRMRLPIYSGLFCNEDNIIEKNDSEYYKYTLLKEWRDNKMYEIDFYSRYNANRIPSSNTLTLPTSTDFDFQDENGNFFDDSKIKENDLGVVVAYKNIIEDGDTALEFGLGSQPGANQFSLYSVDTTNNYSVNAGVFVNKSSDSDLSKFGDNSVQSLTTNNTIYLSQNTSNSYSEATDLQTISTTNALVVEYESNKPFIPSEIELYQQASFPDPSLAGFETTLGAGINLAHFTQGGGSVVVNTKLASSADSRGFDNITGDFANCLVIGSPWTITIDYGSGITKNIKHFRLWARNSHSPNETPLSVEIFGSNDNFTTQTSLFNSSWLLTDVPTITGNITPSHNLNLSLKKDLTTTGDFRYYKFVFPTAQHTYYSIGELALYEKVLTTDTSVLGAGVSLSDFTTNNTNSAITPFNLFSNSVLSRGFDNITGVFDKCLCLNNGNGPAVLFVNFGDTGVKISKFRIWARSDFRNEMVRKMVVEGSMDNITYTTLFDNQSSPFNTGNSGNNYAGDYPITTAGMIPSQNLDKALTRTLNNQAAYKYYNFKFYENSIPITNGSYLIGELGLYTSGADNNTTSRFPKTIQIQGQQINSTSWTTLDTHSLSSSPPAAGGSTLPSNPSLTSFLPPIKEPFNQVSLSYKKLRLVITETFALSGNNVNIGEWVLRKKNNFTTYLGDASTPFDVNDVELKAYFPTANIDLQFTEDPNVFVNFNPAGSPTPKDALRDGNLSTDMDITMNTTATYSTTANQVIIGSNQGAGQRFLGLEYKLTQSNPLGEVFNDFLIYTSSILAKLPFLPKGVIIIGITEDGGQEGLFDGDLTSSQPTQATDVSIGANSPYGAVLDKNASNDRFKSFLMLIKSTFNLSTNRCVIPDIIVSGYDSTNHIVHNTPFIGFTCRNQISSLNKYRIPRPINGELFGIPRSLQNNSLSFINSWERKVKNDDKGVRVVKVELENTPVLITAKIPPITPSPVITAEFYGGNPTTNAAIKVEVSINGPIVNINNLIITNNGEHFESVPNIVFKEDGNAVNVNSSDWLTKPEINITLGTFKTSYNAGVDTNNQSQFPYLMLGSNDVNVSFDTTQSRMSLSNMHTLMKQGQEDNNMQRYYDASMFFNADKPLVVPDGESGNDVMKIGNKKTYCNSTRAGFTESKPNDDFNTQIIPISNPAIRQKGIASGISGIGLLELFARKKDGSYNKISIDNENTYNGTLLDRLGFNLKQLLPRFGTQNEVFNRGLYNKNIKDNDKALSQYNQQVLPLTTNGFINSTLNASLNTNAVNYEVASLDGNNLLEKNVPQESDALIATNLPNKFSYSHLLLYSNIIPKYNYIAAEKINKTTCVASINRSYQTGNIVFGNQPGIPYIVDKKYVLTDIDVDLRTELGIPAPIDSGSTIVFKIDKRKNIPIQVKND